MKLRRSSGRAEARWSPGGRSSRQARPRTETARSANLGGARRTARRFRWRLTPPRAAAILVLLGSIGGLYGLASTSAFTLARTELPSLTWTTREALVAAVDTAEGTNLFRIETPPIEDRLRMLPGVADAAVEVSLPDTLVVHVVERTAILTWKVGDVLFLVDRAGVIFATAPPDDPAGASLPTIVDARPDSTKLAVGSTLDPIDLDAATRLASLRPADVGSVATSLIVSVSEANGFVVSTAPKSWVAVFGLYTRSLRTPDMIPGQVRLLRSLLANGEDTIAKVILADERNGTYVPRATPAP